MLNSILLVTYLIQYFTQNKTMIRTSQAELPVHWNGVHERHDGVMRSTCSVWRLFLPLPLSGVRENRLEQSCSKQ